jgi:hypothetical protein
MTIRILTLAAFTLVVSEGALRLLNARCSIIGWRLAQALWWLLVFVL